MLMLSDIKVPLSSVRVNCVLQFFILCFIKPITLWENLYSFKNLGTHSWGTLSKLFCNPCTTQISFPFLAVVKCHFLDHKFILCNHTNHVYILSVLVEKYRFVPGLNLSYLPELMLEICRLLKDNLLVDSF